MCKALLMKNEIILFTDGNINIEASEISFRRC